MAEPSFKPTPRNPLVGRVADALLAAQSKGGPVARFFLGGAPQMADDLSYQGGTPFTGTGEATQLKPGMLDLAMIGPDARDLFKLAPGLLGPLLAKRLEQVGPVQFSHRHGLGYEQLPYEARDAGFDAIMKPSRFLELARPLPKSPAGQLDPFDADRIEAIEDMLKQGVPISNPTLNIAWNPERQIYQVMGHEGRGRTTAISRFLGNEPYPVHVVETDFSTGDYIPPSNETIQRFMREAFPEQPVRFGRLLRNESPPEQDIYVPNKNILRNNFVDWWLEK